MGRTALFLCDNDTKKRAEHEMFKWQIMSIINIAKLFVVTKWIIQSEFRSAIHCIII